MASAARIEKTIGGKDHRPYPLPKGSWVLGMSWHDLLFMHRPVPEARLRPLVPLTLDAFDGSAWLGDIHHRLRPLQAAEVEELEMTAQIGLPLPHTRPVLHFARRLDVVAWPPKRIEP